MRIMRAVIFDMDGVIIDSEPFHFRLERVIFEELGIGISDIEHEKYLGTNSHEMFDQIRKRFGLARSVEELVQDERSRYLEILRSPGIPVIPGIPNLVKKIAEAGMSMAIASSAPHEQIELVMKNDFGRHFPVRVSGDDVERSKPDPGIFIRAAELLDIPPSECWVIEDSVNGISAANSAGMTSIGFINPESGTQNLAMSNHLIRSIDEAAGIILA